MASSSLERRPTYEMLDLIPQQGDWSEREYLQLDTNRVIEFTNGFLEFLPIPDEVHQAINFWLATLVHNFLRKHGKGVMRQCPFKIRVGDESFREPDVSVLADENDPRRGNVYWNSADLVIEIVSKDNPERDYYKKRIDYAAAGVKEYWIVDPRREAVLQLKLVSEAYEEVGTFRRGDTIASIVLPGLEFDVSDCLDIAKDAPTNQEPLT